MNDDCKRLGLRNVRSIVRKERGETQKKREMGGCRMHRGSAWTRSIRTEITKEYIVGDDRENEKRERRENMTS
jgi:hypothetical protein